MIASKLCINKIKEFEGLRLKAYKCPSGKLTIGYGHTKDVVQDQKITDKEAEELLLLDLKEVYRVINSRVIVKTQGQFDALCSFIFNIKTSEFLKSTLLKYINEGRSNKDIQLQFKRWIYSNGQVLDGLVKRREWESERWTQ